MSAERGESAALRQVHCAGAASVADRGTRCGIFTTALVSGTEIHEV